MVSAKNQKRILGNQLSISSWSYAPKGYHIGSYGWNYLRAQRKYDRIIFQYYQLLKDSGISIEDKLFDINGIKGQSAYDELITKFLHEYVRIFTAYIILDNYWVNILNKDRSEEVNRRNKYYYWLDKINDTNYYKFTKGWTHLQRDILQDEVVLHEFWHLLFITIPEMKINMALECHIISIVSLQFGIWMPYLLEITLTATVGYYRQETEE